MYTVQYFSDIDEEISTFFTNIGMKRYTARVLTILLKEIDISSRDLERWTDLRQPEVSLAITELFNRNWIQKTRHPTEHKGRPIQIYRLALPVENILDDLQQTLSRSYQKSLENIDRIRLLIRESRNRE